MSKVLHRLNTLAICLLGGVLGAVLVAQVWPRSRALAQAGEAYDERQWPQTLQVYPSHPADPVKLVKIMKAGEELVPGEYEMPKVAGDTIENSDASRAWAKDLSFIVESQTSKNIVSVGISVIFPGRRTGFDCASFSGPGAERWCGAHPHWCDGGCPILVEDTFHWGRIPAGTASGLQARYRPEAKGEYGDRFPLEGKRSLQLGSGEQLELLAADRVVGVGEMTDPRLGAGYYLFRILYEEGIEEAKGAKPCVERRNSKTGCAFADIPKFNVAIDIVYFDDGTIWGNFGYGYARPNPDGIYTRVNVPDPPGAAGPTPGPE